MTVVLHHEQGFNEGVVSSATYYILRLMIIAEAIIGPAPRSSDTTGYYDSIPNP